MRTSRQMKKNRGDMGFTLIEALVVLAIIMMTVFAVPAWHAYMEGQGVRLAADQLRGDLYLARLMAINQRKICSVVLNQPGIGCYTNSLNRQVVDLSSFRGGVAFTPKGPCGGTAGSRISFNRQGMSTSAVPVDVFLSDQKGSRFLRIRVTSPGGISLTRWNGSGWK